MNQFARIFSSNYVVLVIIYANAMNKTLDCSNDEDSPTQDINDVWGGSFKFCSDHSNTGSSIDDGTSTGATLEQRDDRPLFPMKRPSWKEKGIALSESDEEYVFTQEIPSEEEEEEEGTFAAFARDINGTNSKKEKKLGTSATVRNPSGFLNKCVTDFVCDKRRIFLFRKINFHEFLVRNSVFLYSSSSSSDDDDVKKKKPRVEEHAKDKGGRKEEEVCPSCKGTMASSCQEKIHGPYCIQAVLYFFENRVKVRATYSRTLDEAYEVFNEAYNESCRYNIFMKHGYYCRRNDRIPPRCMDEGSRRTALDMFSDPTLLKRLRTDEEKCAKTYAEDRIYSKYSDDDE